MAKKFKKFRKNYDDEWGDMNEDRMKEKQRGKNRKDKRESRYREKLQNFKDFRD